MKRDQILLGILLMLGAVFLFTILNTLVKALGETYPVNQIVFFRNLLAMIPVLAVMAMEPGSLGRLRTERPLGHLWRGVIGGTCMVLMFWGFTLLPLANAVALSFASPLITVALSVPLLGEKVGIHRWSAVVVGFLGVLVMVQPGADAALYLFGSLVMLASAFGQALAVTTVRQLSRTESANTIVFYFTLLVTVMSGFTLPFSYVPIASWHDFGLFLGAGLSGGFAQLLMTRAYAAAPTAVVAPFNYTSIVLAGAIGWVVWGEVPELHTILGALLVVACGLYILYRETVRKVTREVSPSLTE